MPTVPINVGEEVFEESQNPNEEADEVIPEGPAANMTSTWLALLPRKKKLT